MSPARSAAQVAASREITSRAGPAAAPHGGVLISFRLRAHNLPGSEPNETANQCYDPRNEHGPVRSCAAELDTQSPKIERTDEHGDKKTYSEKQPIHGITFASAKGKGPAMRDNGAPPNRSPTLAF